MTPPMSRPRVAAGALFTDSDGNILLVKPNYKDGWDIPGGYVEPGETPIEACIREIKEELGIDRPVHSLLVADWAPSEREGDKLLFIFDGGAITAADIDSFDLQAAEIDRVALHPASGLDGALIPRLARRVRAAVQAQQASRTSYLEHGRTPRGDVTGPVGDS